MQNYICKTCGTQFSASDNPPPHCPICEDERQYIGWNGQTWTTMEALRQDHHNIFKTVENRLTGIGTHPGFAIGQRALLVQTSEGNVLWDCISLVDQATIALVRSLGGIAAIAISHPHFYTSMVEWSHIFEAPIYLHSADRQWVQRLDPAIHFWDGETKSIGEGLTLIRCGGHFTGSTVLHWAQGMNGKGALLSGDTLQVVSDRRYVSFMYSYPNLIPLPAQTIKQIVAAVEPYAFERVYGGWWERNVYEDAKHAVIRSAERYLQMTGEG
jgi:glyoxylase-like metal-dependent hydrolase (beta-lactamase superfamily II)